jgi:hypothetical protein
MHGSATYREHFSYYTLCYVVAHSCLFDTAIYLVFREARPPMSYNEGSPLFVY